MFMRTIRLVTILGFDVKVDASWLLIAALRVWSLSTGYFPDVAPGLRQQDYLVLSVAAMLAMFGCLIAHELAHALIARQFGLKIGGITLFLYGGVAELESEPEDPRSEFWIAIAGPVMSLSLAAALYLLLRLADRIGSAVPLQAGLGYLALINLVLALFNLMPAFPLDGGRVLRAALWTRTGDLIRATRTATRISAVFACLLIGLGFLSLFSTGSVGGIWQVVVGLFLLSSAQGSYQQLVVQTALGSRTVADLMTADPVIVGPAATLSELAGRTMLGHAVSFVPVVEAGRLIGYIDTQIVQRIEPENWPITHVGDVYVAADADNTVRPELSAQALIKRIATTGRRKFLVRKDEDLVGVISLTDLVPVVAVLQDLGSSRSRRDPEDGAGQFDNRHAK